MILGGGGGGGVEKGKRDCFELMNHRDASVICVSCPFSMRYSSVLTVTRPEGDRSTTQVERTSNDTYSIPTGCLTHENWTK